MADKPSIRGPKWARNNLLVLTVACSHCESAVGEPCVNGSAYDRESYGFHLQRWWRLIDKEGVVYAHDREGG